jgi:hypothetical protein
LKDRTHTYYLMVVLLLLLLAIPKIINSFLAEHPLRFLYLTIFSIGLFAGYLRYALTVKRKDMRRRLSFQKYGIFLLFILAYVILKAVVRRFFDFQVPNSDYIVLMAIFALGLFITNYGFYSAYLWKTKPRKGPPK